jgi:uncharacterized integral membrane protein (TIGR00698 family)
MRRLLAVANLDRGLVLPDASSLARARELVPGVLACTVIAIAAAFVAQQYAAPVMLIALLLGMAMNFLSAEGACVPGIEFTARTVLRVGVALLGLRITLLQIVALGWHPVALVLFCVIATIATAIVAARLLGFQTSFGVLTGGATAICGASAALALSAALPAHPLKERATLFTVVGVSALSTLAMILYPIIVHAIGLDAHQSGVFLGGTIHDVAQVVGAGYSMSRETGDVATVIKLLRVATLLPVILFAGIFTRMAGGQPGAARPPLLPGFAVAFALFVLINSTGLIPETVANLGSDFSRWALVAAVAALGMKTRLRELATVGFKPVALMVGETAFLAVLVLVLMRWAV